MHEEAEETNGAAAWRWAKDVHRESGLARKKTRKACKQMTREKEKGPRRRQPFKANPHTHPHTRITKKGACEAAAEHKGGRERERERECDAMPGRSATQDTEESGEAPRDHIAGTRSFGECQRQRKNEELVKRAGHVQEVCGGAQTVPGLHTLQRRCALHLGVCAATSLPCRFLSLSL